MPHRNISSGNELRATIGMVVDFRELKFAVPPHRKPSQIPSYYWDIEPSTLRNRSWKQFRRTQYRGLRVPYPT